MLTKSVPEFDDTGLSDLQIYLDDLLISTASFTEHISRLRLLFHKIFISGMTLKFKKCEFIKKQIKFLGHIINPAGMAMDPDKLLAVHEFPAKK